MSAKKKNKAVDQPSSTHKFEMNFGKENYRWMLIGLAVIVLGFVLMYGNTDDQFNGTATFDGELSMSTHIKITLAPIIVLLGFAIEIFAILKKPATEVSSNDAD